MQDAALSCAFQLTAPIPLVCGLSPLSSGILVLLILAWVRGDGGKEQARGASQYCIMDGDSIWTVAWHRMASHGIAGLD